MKKPLNCNLVFNPIFQILFAIAAGVMLGYFDPVRALQVKFLGDVFIDVIRLIVGPIIFCSVTSGIAAMRNMRQFGEVGIKAFVYFEVLSFLALTAGLLGAHVLQPGVGFRLDTVAPMASMLPALAPTSSPSSGIFLMTTLADTFFNNGMLQLLLCAFACGIALALAGERAHRLTAFCDQVAGWLFQVVKFVLKAAPLAAFGAIAFTVGRYGLMSIAPLLKLLGAIYVTTFLFAVVVLGVVARWSGFSLWRFMMYIKEELLIVIGTASSVAAMPKLIEKLKGAGCADAVAHTVVPAGYSFNLNGSNVYLTLALVFLAQASNINLGFVHYAMIVAVAMITSKGSSGIAGSAFVALTATLAVVPDIPVSSLLLIVGIERLLKCRSLTNIIGNGVACIAVSAWAHQLDRSKLDECCRAP